MQNVHFLSLTPEWATPVNLFNELNQEFCFTLDPCATPENAKCARFYTAADNGLSKSWANEVVFMNPPYGRVIGDWVRKAYQEASENGAVVVCLIPSRTDTKYWHKYCMKANEIRFLEGRVSFGAGVGPAPFPSCIVVFGGAVEQRVQRMGALAPGNGGHPRPFISSVSAHR